MVSPAFCTSIRAPPKPAKACFFQPHSRSVQSEPRFLSHGRKTTLRADRGAGPLHLGIGRGRILDERGGQSEIGNSSACACCALRNSGDTNVSATPSYNRFGSSSEALSGPEPARSGPPGESDQCPTHCLNQAGGLCSPPLSQCGPPARYRALLAQV